jgi:hypothetical protein
MPSPVWKTLNEINTFDGDFGVAAGGLSGGSTPGSGAFPAANDAILVPFYVPQMVRITRFFSINGSTANGNIDVGIYTFGGARIASAGSTAQAGTNSIQMYAVTDFTLGAGAYYMAVAMDGTTGTLFRASLSVVRCQGLGMAKMASAFPLPSTVTLATVTAAYCPLIGAEIYSL